MELKSRFNLGMDAELDSELDQIGVILDSPMICGSCLAQMDQVGKHLYRCSRCGTTYDEIAS